MTGARASLALASLLVAAPALAQTPADFYAGKTIALTVSSTPGGGYDVYARTFARFLPKHLPGQPAVVVQHQPGGGGLVAANTLYNVAPRDGTALALLQGGSLLVGALGEPAAKFDGERLTGVGNLNEDADTCTAWRDSGIETARDFLTKPVILGVAGASSASYTFSTALMDVLGAKFTMIAGYQGAATSRTMAMEKGELQATCGIFVSTVQTQFADLVKSGKLRVVLQIGLARHPAFPDTPGALEFAKDAEGRQALELLFSQLSLGRPVFAPPGVPPDRAKLLQAAFSGVMADPDFIAEAGRINLETRWYDAARMAEVMRGMSAAAPSARARARKILGMQ